MSFLVAALYKFVTLERFGSLKHPLLEVCKSNDVVGTLLLAREGINGTIAGPDEGIKQVLAFLRSHPELADLTHKESRASERPFHRMRVSLKREIVTMGVPEVDPNRVVGEYVKPADWNALISDPDVVLIDTRNEYEVTIGTFEGAVDPKTASFRDFPEWSRANADMLNSKKKVAMFCTGGIRCEKATSFLIDEGYESVYHLEGGILKYLEEVPEAASLWRGQCFVFDDRVSVGHALEEGDYDMCHGCRHPISAADMASPMYQKGVSCPHCYDQTSDEQKARFAERQKQIALSAARGEAHLGVDPRAAQDD